MLLLREMAQVVAGQQGCQVAARIAVDGDTMRSEWGLRMSASTFRVVQRGAVLEQIFSFHFTQTSRGPT